MAKNLIVVESPAKCRTLTKYLGKDFDILATYGHVRDLVPKIGAVDPANHFNMKYRPIEKNLKHVDAICESLKSATVLYLATDPDREGEAIAWHLYELVKERAELLNKIVYRVAFYEITKIAVLKAIKNPRRLSMDLVNAQQARRALDYLVGFNLSPLLWKKIRRGLSAGRVQSPALRIIVERAIKIEKFKSQEYWTIEAKFKAKKKNIIATLTTYHEEKIKQFSITTQTQAEHIGKKLFELTNGQLVVDKIIKSSRRRNPTAPFTTSTLQQEAVRKLAFSTQQAMRVAQQLYEGVNGTMGLISYMRTDAVNLSNEAIESICNLIKERHGSKCLPKTPRYYKAKSKNIQEAHEAIRPTMIAMLPDMIKQHLTIEQYKLYTLIWKRTIACQMIHATIHQVAIDFACGDDNRFRAHGSTVVNPGFTQIYQEDIDDAKEKTLETFLPPLQKGDRITLTKFSPVQHFTEPPPRYSEASLVKSLEEHGIGRPSTYAAIISTIQQRGYVILKTKRFKPTGIGHIVNKFLTKYFTQYVDYDFTAKLEDDLDAVSRGEKPWLPLLENFWNPFIQFVKITQKNIQRKEVTQEGLNEKCPKCLKSLSILLGKQDRFIGCSAYPECDFTRNLDKLKTSNQIHKIVKGRICPSCEAQLIIKTSQYGKFIGCSSYPKCNFIESFQKSEETNITCPNCMLEVLIKRKSRHGTFFYACNSYPTCRYTAKHPLLNEPCPICMGTFLMLKSTKQRGSEKTCPQKRCAFVTLIANNTNTAF